MQTGRVLGILGALAGVSATVYSTFIYLVGGLNGTGNPYAGREGFWIGALALAIVAGVGAAIALRRPEVGSLLMLGSAYLGTAAISLFYINTWYALAIPLCSLGAILVLNAAKGSTAATLRWVVLVLLASAVVAGYLVAGWLAAVVFAAILVIAVVLMLTRAAIP